MSKSIEAVLTWHQPDQKPTGGSIVWVIEAHSKKIRPLSFSLHAGRVVNARETDDWIVQQADETGCCSCYWTPEDIYAWAYDEEGKLLPNFD